MNRHPYFDLWLHDDVELADLLGSPLVERTTLHEWPLSCVQRLRMCDGRTRIYKVQAQPTVEPTFYARARSSLLTGVQDISQPEVRAALLLDDIAAPRLVDLQMTEGEAVNVGEILLEQIGRITGELPSVADIRTVEQWAMYADTVVANLVTLVNTGTFHKVDHALIKRLKHHLESPTVLAGIEGEVGYVHHDLSGDNVFLLSDSYRVIDWQRPMWGPIALDMACLLESLGFDPRRYVDAGVMQLLYLLRIAWFVQCTQRWFPAGAATYDVTIVQLMAQVEHVGAG